MQKLVFKNLNRKLRKYIIYYMCESLEMGEVWLQLNHFFTVVVSNEQSLVHKIIHYNQVPECHVTISNHKLHLLWERRMLGVCDTLLPNGSGVWKSKTNIEWKSETFIFTEKPSQMKQSCDWQAWRYMEKLEKLTLLSQPQPSVGCKHGERHIQQQVWAHLIGVCTHSLCFGNQTS